MAFGDQALADHLARLVNEATAAEIASSRRRFAGLAVLPLPDADRALAELRHALDVLGLDGVVLLSNVLGRYPGDPSWAPLFDELEGRGAYVLLHPAAPPYELPIAAHPPWVYEFPFETTRAIAGLISAGAPERWPGIRFQVAHLGGTIPFLAERLAGLGDPAATRVFLRGLFYDTALATDPLARATSQARPRSSSAATGPTSTRSTTPRRGSAPTGRRSCAGSYTAFGSRKCTRVPTGASSSQIWPPWASTIAREIASPSPAPVSRRDGSAR
jgi:predicted TIM-barrel fold metal-dependent hydrolase